MPEPPDRFGSVAQDFPRRVSKATADKPVGFGNLGVRIGPVAEPIIGNDPGIHLSRGLKQVGIGRGAFWNDHHLICLELELAHTYQVLVDPCQALLVAMHQELGKEFELRADLLERAFIIL